MEQMLDQAIAFIQNSAMAQVGLVSIILEFAFRMIKTEQPLSIAHMIAGSLHKLSILCEKVAALMDKVLPQKLK